MGEYLYVAKNLQGHVFRGSLQAASSREAARTIQEQGLYISKLKTASRKSFFRNTVLWKVGQAKYTALFCRQLSVMISAGLSVSDSMRILAVQEGKMSRKHILMDVYEQLQTGNMLADALKKYEKIFSRKMIYLIAAGEASGNLEVVLESLAAYLEKSYVAQEKLKTIMLYPIFLLVTAFLVVGFVLSFVLPTFVALFVDLQIELPLPTRILLGISYGFISYGWLLLFVPVGIVIFNRTLQTHGKFRLWLSHTLLGLPLFGRLQINIELMHFSSTLSVLLTSGIVADKALGIVRDITDNYYLQRVLERVREDVEKGYAMSVSLQREHIFPPLMLELLTAGEATGEVDLMLQKISDFCQIDAVMLSERIQALIEPVMILLLGLLIGTMVLAIAMPILNTITAFS